MTTQKKITLITIGSYAGALVAILALCGIVWSNILVPQINIIAEAKIKENNETILDKLDKIYDKVNETNERLARHEGAERFNRKGVTP